MTTADVYDAIVAFLEKEQRTPTVRELCKITGMSSTNSVQKHIYKLRAVGLVKKSNGKRLEIVRRRK